MALIIRISMTNNGANNIAYLMTNNGLIWHNNNASDD
jgi:hypothetical protein